jgi:uncharacterized protein YndB with AHSA1/START domain
MWFMADPIHSLPMAVAELQIAASPDRVWQALVTSEGLKPWLGDGATIEAVEGGALSAPDPVGGRTRRGRVERIDDGRRLVFTWWPVTNPAERSTVAIVVEPVDSHGAATVVKVNETAPASVTRALSADAAVVSDRPVARAAVGAWSWRLALLGLASKACLV